jgi:hypothetical protein
MIPLQGAYWAAHLMHKGRTKHAPSLPTLEAGAGGGT